MMGTSWMGSRSFARKHPLFNGMPADQVMGLHNQTKGGGSNGWRVEDEQVEVPCAYAREHDRNFGAGTVVARVAGPRVVLHRCVVMQPVLFARFPAKALLYLSGTKNV